MNGTSLLNSSECPASGTHPSGAFFATPHLPSPDTASCPSSKCVARARAKLSAWMLNAAEAASVRGISPSATACTIVGYKSDRRSAKAETVSALRRAKREGCVNDTEPT